MSGRLLPVLVVGLALAAVGCGDSGGEGSTSRPQLNADSVSNPYPNVDPANSRRSTGPIDSSSVSDLEVAWTLPLTARATYGSFSSAPVVKEGVVYAQDLMSNVMAIDLETGKVLWSKRYEAEAQGPNGLVVVGDRIYGATSVAAFALDRQTGRQIWSVQLANNEDDGIDIAPGYDDGRVFVATVPGTATAFYTGEAGGTVWALDAKTGRKLWHFDTVPKSLWGDRKTNSGGGVWQTPAFDGRGSMYFGVGNPAPSPGARGAPWGSSRPGRNLYTDSIVKLDTETGRLDWYFQLTPHDLYGWDLQGPPILISVGGRELVVITGKSGIVIALDVKSGKLVWKRPVGKHNGHDDDGLLALRGQTAKLRPPFEIYPGSVGGVIAPMSTNGSSVFAPVVNHPATVSSPWKTTESLSVNEGELVALDAGTGKIEWQHAFPQAPAFGATSSVNDVVFITTFDGMVSALDEGDGGLLWQEKLPAGTNTGVTVAGDTVIAPAGYTAEGGTAKIVAYRLGG